MSIRDIVRSILYSYLAWRRPPGWRSMYEVDYDDIHRVGLYHVKGKLGDTVYLILLARQILIQRDWDLRVFTSTSLAPIWRALCPTAEIVTLSEKQGGLCLTQRMYRFAIARQKKGQIDLLLTLDSGEDFQTLLDFRAMAATHNLAPGRKFIVILT